LLNIHLFIRENESRYWTEQYKTEQHITRQNNTRQVFMVLNNFLSYTIFGGQNVILVFLTTCRWDKKLWCGLWGTRIYVFVICLMPLVCLSLKQFYRSNIVQLELSCHVLHFLTNQTHSKSLIYQSLISIMNIWMMGRIVHPRPPFAPRSQDYTTNEVHQIFQQKFMIHILAFKSTSYLPKNLNFPRPGVMIEYEKRRRE
jgi:hypothetical protein